MSRKRGGKGLGMGGRLPKYRRIYRARRAPRRRLYPRSIGESKYFDTFLSAAAVPESTDWTGTETDPAVPLTLFAPQEGSDINQRVGRKVSVYKIHLKGYIQTTVTQNSDDVFAPPATRCILYVDQQTNAAQAQGEQVMAMPGAATAPLVASSFQNTDNFGRFRVLSDRVYDGRDQSALTDGASTGSLSSADIPLNIKFTFKKPINVRFNGTNGGTVADIVDNSFHFLMQKSATVGTHTVSYQVRTYYKDI